MKRIAMAVLMFGITSCAVETAPVSTAADDSAQTTTSTSSEATDREASPHAVQCDDGVCESASQCVADGGFSEGACIIRGTICCVTD